MTDDPVPATDGFTNEVLHVYSRGPGDSPGNQLVHMCPVCDQTREGGKGHAPDCTFRPVPAPETRETILSARDVEVMRWHAEGATTKCEIGPHGTTEPESGETIGYCGKCGWAAPLQRLAQSHEALRAALATERAARIAVENKRDHERHEKETVSDALGATLRWVQKDRDDFKQRAEQAEASLSAMTAELAEERRLHVSRWQQQDQQRQELTAERDALRTALERILACDDAVDNGISVDAPSWDDAIRCGKDALAALAAASGTERT